jgi:hypothetical protein
MKKIKIIKLVTNQVLFVFGYLLLSSSCFSMNLLQDVNGDRQLLQADKDSDKKFTLVDNLFERHISQKELSNLMANHIKATMLEVPENCKIKFSDLISFQTALWLNGENEINREIEKVLNEEEVYRKAKNSAHFFAVQLSLGELNELLTLPRTKAISALIKPALLDVFVRANSNHYKEVGRVVFENMCTKHKP